jgi:hypothetical protein
MIFNKCSNTFYFFLNGESIEEREPKALSAIILASAVLVAGAYFLVQSMCRYKTFFSI